ncbi:hypothetical protein [Noviluteimonas gilva]|uniref:DNA transfer protein p32 n=1 Tax=Noviluteimonas gilva TaxID=2682097 RepID=A0A7C9HXV7_9GAMM|nr:hypothetical protein [Lysobacter gilvus]MUV13594.1 hypothetical protein [Lysobacter gilvus]
MAAKKGADASSDATYMNIWYQQQRDAQNRADNLPFMQSAYGALGRQNDFLNGDYSGFMNSPDYKFRFDQGMQGLDRSAAARGGLYSGGHTADTIQYGQGMAAQGMNDYWAKLAGQAGQGYQAVANVGQMGQQGANAVGNAIMQNGANRASSYAQQGQNWQQTAGALGNAFTYWNSNRGS